MSIKTLCNGFLTLHGVSSDLTGTIKGSLNLPQNTKLNGVSLASTLESKASISNPIFTGTVNLPSMTNVIVGGTPLNTIMQTGSIGFGTAVLVGTNTIQIPFRNLQNTSNINIGTSYNPIITVDSIVETLPTPSNLYYFTGNGTADSSGNSYNLTITSGTIIGTDAVKGGAITLTSGKLAYSVVPSSNWTSGSGHTLSFDFKYSTTGAWTQILRCGHTYYTNGEHDGSGWLWQPQPAFGFGFEVTGGTSRIIFGHNGGNYRAIGLIQYSTGFVSNTWYHIDIVFYSGGTNVNNPHLYVNNSRVTGSYSGYSASYFQPRDVLRFGNSTHHEYGTTDKNPTFANMRVTPTALTSEQRAVLVANTPISPLTTQIVSRNTNNLEFKILDRSFGYIPIVTNKSLLNINVSIVDGSTIKASGNIPISHL
jgi:hypothetical protein